MLSVSVHKWTGQIDTFVTLALLSTSHYTPTLQSGYGVSTFFTVYVNGEIKTVGIPLFLYHEEGGYIF